jgi:hypothetical protein
MNTIRNAPQMELVISSAMALVARAARAVLAAIRSAVDDQDSTRPIVWGRWSW